LGDQDREGQGSSLVDEEDPKGSQGGLQQLEDAESSGEETQELRSPLFAAEHSERYERQTRIREYEAKYHCRLGVMSDVIFPASITYLEELLWDASTDEDFHLLLESPGGDGETALRLVRQAQSRCQEFSVIVPDQAKSAGTLLAMGAHHILMGPTSDLGPVDPQFQIGDERNLVAAKDIIASVVAAEEAVAKNPDVYPIHAALLSEVTAVMVQQARSAIGRTSDLVLEVLMCCDGRDETTATEMMGRIQPLLIDAPKHHGAVVDAKTAQACGLPITVLDPKSAQWRDIWRLYAKYFAFGRPIYEGRISSRVPAWAEGGPS
jgi:hypothetical protein